MSEFTVKVLKQVDRISNVIPQDEIDRRTDLRDFVIFTIDGEDAKDLDDANVTARSRTPHIKV